MGSKRVTFNDSYMPNGKSRFFHLAAVYKNRQFEKHAAKKNIVRRARLSDSQSPQTAAKRIGKGTLESMKVKVGDFSKSAIIAIRRHRGINGKQEEFKIYEVGWTKNPKPASYKGTIAQFSKQNPMYRPYKMYATPLSKLAQSKRERIEGAWKEYTLVNDLKSLRI